MSRGLRDHLDVDLVEVSFPATSRLRAVAADALWYPRLRAPSGVDVLHCPTFRGPFRSRAPLVVTVHDLAVLRHPEWFNRWTATYSRVAVPRVVACGGSSDRRLGAHQGRARRAARRRRREDPGRAERGRGRLHARGPEGRGRLRARGRDARAAQEPCADRRGRRRRAARRRRARLGRRRPSGERHLARRRLRRRSSPRSTAVRAVSSTPRCTRASGSRSPRRSPAAARSSRAATRRWRRSRAATPRTSIRPTSNRSARESRRAFAPAPRRIASWHDVAGRTRAVYEELA